MILSIRILCLYLMCLCLSGAAAMRVVRTERSRNGVIFSLGLSLLFKLRINFLFQPLECFPRSGWMWSEDHWFGPDLIGAEKWGNENVSLAEPFHLDLCKSAFSTGLITASAGTGKRGAKRVV